MPAPVGPLTGEFRSCVTIIPDMPRNHNNNRAFFRHNGFFSGSPARMRRGKPPALRRIARLPFLHRTDLTMNSTKKPDFV